MLQQQHLQLQQSQSPQTAQGFQLPTNKPTPTTQSLSNTTQTVGGPQNSQPPPPPPIDHAAMISGHEYHIQCLRLRQRSLADDPSLSISEIDNMYERLRVRINCESDSISDLSHAQSRLSDRSAAPAASAVPPPSEQVLPKPPIVPVAEDDQPPKSLRANFRDGLGFATCKGDIFPIVQLFFAVLENLHPFSRYGSKYGAWLVLMTNQDERRFVRHFLDDLSTATWTAVIKCVLLQYHLAKEEGYDLRKLHEIEAFLFTPHGDVSLQTYVQRFLARCNAAFPHILEIDVMRWEYFYTIFVHSLPLTLQHDALALMKKHREEAAFASYAGNGSSADAVTVLKLYDGAGAVVTNDAYFADINNYVFGKINVRGVQDGFDFHLFLRAAGTLLSKPANHEKYKNKNPRIPFHQVPEFRKAATKVVSVTSELQLDLLLLQSKLSQPSNNPGGRFPRTENPTRTNDGARDRRREHQHQPRRDNYTGTATGTWANSGPPPRGDAHRDSARALNSSRLPYADQPCGRYNNNGSGKHTGHTNKECHLQIQERAAAQTKTV